MNDNSVPRRQTVPPLLPVEPAGWFASLSRDQAYRAAKRNELPCVTFGRRKYVVTAKLEAILGRRLTVEDVEAAESAVAARKAS